MAHTKKIRIGHRYKGDFSILQQQIDQAIKRGIVDISSKKQQSAEYKQYQQIIERRIQQFYINCSTKFRNSIEYCKTTDKNVQKIVMQPDANLQKINDVKMSMLKQLKKHISSSNYPEISIPIQIGLPQKLEIDHCNQYKQDINDMFEKMNNSVANYDERIHRIKQLEKLAIKTANKLQIQEKYDRNKNT